MTFFCLHIYTHVKVNKAEIPNFYARGEERFPCIYISYYETAALGVVSILKLHPQLLKLKKDTLYTKYHHIKTTEV